MGSYKHIQKTFIAGYKERSPTYRARITEWKKEPTVTRVKKPTNIARARTLGYLAKIGYIVVRVKIRKGMRRRHKPSGGRKPSKSGRFMSPDKSHQQFAEEKASRRYRNCEVLNSYWVGEDGQVEFFEVILLERIRPEIKEKAKLRKGRAFRGLTSVGKRSRGLKK
ncbi:MAG: 50S ribosomal protein L15e [Candidatus Micrarchaeota archaeon]